MVAFDRMLNVCFTVESATLLSVWLKLLTVWRRVICLYLSSYGTYLIQFRKRNLNATFVLLAMFFSLKCVLDSLQSLNTELINMTAERGPEGFSVNRLVHLSILPSVQNFVPEQDCQEIHPRSPKNDSQWFYWPTDLSSVLINSLVYGKLSKK